MTLDRAFDDERWPQDHTGHAVCFLCGKKVDPLDPKRGFYTPDAKTCQPIPIHLPCASNHFAQGKDEWELLRLGMAAVNEMAKANLKRFLSA